MSRGGRRSRVAVGLLLPLLWLALPADAADVPDLVAGVFSPPRAAPDFALRGSDGTELKLSHYRGKLVILAFGFTACPDVCPTTLSTLAEARKQLGEQRSELQIVYLTVDPETDDAERLRTYLAKFDPTFVGGTGTVEQLAAVREQYGIAAARKASATGSAFVHSSYTYLIDREGSLRALMPYGHPPDDYAHDAKILLKP